MRALSVVVLFLAAAGCAEGTDKSGESLAASAPEVSFFPPEAGRGITIDARLSSTESIFDFTGTTLTLGDGVTVNAVTVLDSWNALANITIGPGAPLGYRDASLSTGTYSTVLEQALNVVNDSFTITPDRGLLGETLEIEIEGFNTEWTGGATWANFGEGVEVTSVSVLSENYALATLDISPEAVPGSRDVYMETGTEVTMLYEGFHVDRVSLSATFDPPVAYQGDTVDFTIEGRGTHWDRLTDVEFWENASSNPDIVVDSISVLDAEHLYGTMTLSNAAALGLRDVHVLTPATDGSGDEGVIVADAFEVLDTAADLDDVGISIWFYVTRGIDNDTGELYESVSGGAVFWIPLDPPCGAGSPPADGPQPYDVNGVFASPDPVEQPDCPSMETVGAGDYVWFESGCNIVTLERQVDAASGMIFYSADLTLDDYCFDQVYDLHTQGEDGGIGEYILDGVQPTVPADWYMLTPELWGNYTQSRAEDFNYTWTPAETYTANDAIFATSISGTLVETGKAGFAGALPWDDGDHTYTPSELSALEAGSVSFSAYSYIKGIEFGFPFSSIQDNESESYVYLQAAMVLE